MSIAYLAFGSNLGNRESFIRSALQGLKDQGIEIIKMSRLIETDPVGGPAQGKYLNAVAQIKTSYPPEELLFIIASIEKKLGRIRKIANGPRVIDIDILLYDDIKLVSKNLIIPHPRMWEREFVMKPLKEIASDMI